MRKFAFRLATPLKLKGMEEDRQKTVVAARVKECDANLAKLNLLKDSMKQLQEKLGLELAGRPGIPLDLHKLSLFQGYIPVLTEKIRAQQAKLDESRERLNLARQDLTKIMRDRKILEKLKDKALAEYNREATREEQKTLDDLANAGYFRN